MSTTTRARRAPAPLRALPTDREPCLCTTLRTLARRVTAVYDAHLSAAGLNLPQYRLLARLDGLGTSSLSELAGATELDVTSASRGVRGLIDAGLVDVAEGKNRRTKAYRLSRRGVRTLRDAYGRWRAAQRELQRTVSPEQHERFATLASALSRAKEV